MAKEGASQKPRYVWDREKLLWVEAADRPTVKEEVIERSIEEVADVAADEEYYESISAEISPEYAEALEYRGAWVRLLGVVIDIVVLAIFGAIIGAILGAFDLNISRWIYSIIGIFYFIGFWSLRGQSPGKMAIAAKIVKLDGSPIGIRAAFLRYLVYFIYIQAIQNSMVYISLYLSIVILIVIFLAMALNKNKRGLHDLLAGTVVVNSRPSPLDDYEEEEYFEAEEEPVAFEAR